VSNRNEEHNMGSSIWQSQAIEAPRLSLEYVRHQAAKLNVDSRRELGVMYIAIGAAVIMTVVLLLLPGTKAPVLVNSMRVGAVLLVWGAVYALAKIRRWMHPTGSDGETVMTTLEIYRAELQRRRDYYSYMGSWSSLWPVAPGIAVMLLGQVLFDTLPGSVLRLGIVSFLVVAGLWSGFAMYRGKLREFQRELDALSSLEK